MRFPRSLRKSIAAALVFTTLTVPMAGCDFPGGFFDDDKPGGKPPAGTSSRNVKLPEGAVLVDLPQANADRRVVEAIGMDALRYYVHARLATEKLSRVNTKKVKRESYEEYLKQTAALWAQADAFAQLAARLADELAKKEKQPGYKPLAMLEAAPPPGSPFFSVACAAMNESRPPTGIFNQSQNSDLDWYHPGVSRQAYQAQQAKEKWANRFQETYKQFPAGQQIGELAKKLGVDAKTANAQFQEAERALKQGHLSDAQFFNIATKTTLVVKGGCQTALFVCGTILSGGATGPAAFFAALNTVAQGADLVIEIANTAHEVATEETNPTLDKYKETTGGLVAWTSLGSMVTSLKDFALTGEKAVKITQDSLKDAGLKNIHGWLDKHKIGGAGVSAILDWVSWGKDRADDYKQGTVMGYNAKKGTILGFEVFDVNGKTALRPEEIPKESYEAPKEISLIPNDALIQFTKQPEHLKEIIAYVDQQQDTKKRIWEIIEEDAKRRQQIAAAEERRKSEERARNASGSASRQQYWDWSNQPKTQDDYDKAKSQIFSDYMRKMGGGTAGKVEKPEEDAPFTPTRMAGYYTVTTSKGDMAMRVILRATGGNTLSVIEVQKKTDTNGKEISAITIDPKTGKGKTKVGNPVRFNLAGDGTAYMGTLEDGQRIWRFVKH